MRKKLSLFFLGLLILSLIALTIACVTLYQTSYDDLVVTLLANLKRPDLYSTLTQRFFPKSKFELLQKGLLPLAALSALAGVVCLWKRQWLWDRIERFLHSCQQSTQSLWQEVQQSSLTTQGLLSTLLLLIFIRSVLSSFYFPIQYDEAWNYNYFLHSNPFYTLVAYNNYPLHNLITSFFLFFLPDNTFTLRLPVMLFGLLTALSVFIIIRKLFRSEFLALAAVLLFASFPVSIYYMLYARGVMICLFFALWAFYLTIQQVLNPKSTNYRLAAFHSLAFFSLVSYGYFIALSYAFCLGYFFWKKNYAGAWLQIKSALGCAILCFLLMLPLLLGTGLQPGLQTLGAQANLNALSGWPYHNYSEFISGHAYGFYLLLGFNLLSFFLLKEKKYRPILIWMNLSLILPAGFYVLGWSLLPERAMAFLVIPVLFSFVFIAQTLSSSKYLFLIIPIVGYLHYYSYQSNFIQWSRGLDQQTEQLADVLQKNNVRAIYNHSTAFSYFIPGLSYYSNRREENLRFGSADKNSTRFASPQILENGDAVVVSPDSNLHFPVLFRTEDFVVYQKK